MKISKSEIFIALFGIAVSIWTGLLLSTGVMGILWVIGDTLSMTTGWGAGNLTGVGLFVGPIMALRAFGPLIVFLVIAGAFIQRGKKLFIPVRTAILFSLLIMTFSYGVVKAYNIYLKRNPEKFVLICAVRKDLFDFGLRNLFMSEMGKTMMMIGVFFVLAGGLILLLGKIPGFGKLPGDIVIKKENFSFYFPVATCILISLFLSLISYLWSRK